MARRPTAATLRRLDTRLRGVAADRRTGAAGLAAAIVDAIADAARAPPRGVGPGDASLARTVRDRLPQTQPALGPVVRWTGEWKSAGALAPSKRSRWVRSWLRRERDRLRREPPGIARSLAAVLPARARVLTFSRSATVAAALNALRPAQRPVRVLALESRPGGEGRALARDLRAKGIPATCVPDREASQALDRSDLVLLGADAVYRGGELVHKVGTRGLVERARRRGVPVFAVAGRSKFVPDRGPPRTLPALFDRTPGRWITGFVTDRGLWRPAGGRRRHSAR